MPTIDYWTGKVIARRAAILDKGGCIGWRFTDAFDPSKPLPGLKAKIIFDYVGGKDPYTGADLRIEPLGAGLVWIKGWEFAPGAPFYSKSSEEYDAKLERREPNKQLIEAQLNPAPLGIRVGDSSEVREMKAVEAPRLAKQAESSGGHVGILSKENVKPGGLAGLQPDWELYRERVRQTKRRRSRVTRDPKA